MAEDFSKFNSVLGEPARIVEYDTTRLKQEHIAVKELELALQFHDHDNPGMTREAAVKIQRFCRNMMQRRKARRLRDKLSKLPFVVRSGFVKMHVNRQATQRLQSTVDALIRKII